jgi:hypothetical protein
MSFFDKAKAAASQAAAKAKQGAEDLQLKVDLGSAYDDLGKAAYELIERGEIAHEKLDAPAAKVRELRRRMEGEARPDAPADDAPAEEVPAAADAAPSDDVADGPAAASGPGEPAPASEGSEPAAPSS